MKFFVLGVFLVILLVSLQQAQGLDCYKCKSDKSWEDCNGNAKKITCKSSSTKCCRGVYTTTVSETTCTVYQKYCEGDPEKIGDDEKCEGRFSFNWSTASSCCSGNLCNAGAHNLGNHALIMIISAMMFFFLY